MSTGQNPNVITYQPLLRLVRSNLHLWSALIGKSPQERLVLLSGTVVNFFNGGRSPRYQDEQIANDIELVFAAAADTYMLSLRNTSSVTLDWGDDGGAEEVVWRVDLASGSGLAADAWDRACSIRAKAALDIYDGIDARGRRMLSQYYSASCTRLFGEIVKRWCTASSDTEADELADDIVKIHLGLRGEEKSRKKLRDTLRSVIQANDAACSLERIGRMIEKVSRALPQPLSEDALFTVLSMAFVRRYCVQSPERFVQMINLDRMIGRPLSNVAYETLSASVAPIVSIESVATSLADHLNAGGQRRWCVCGINVFSKPPFVQLTRKGGLNKEQVRAMAEAAREKAVGWDNPMPSISISLEIESVDGAFREVFDLG